MFHKAAYENTLCCFWAAVFAMILVRHLLIVTFKIHALSTQGQGWSY